ncbi:hypothetical protein [Tolypothrix sp. PCC 7601]|uniref:hypothetical protein n=1 Tax=Tolypothrix sp. PCC 7601 TaxID=1188 RepID=UPI0005EABA45|nr:hypothetical protein [Tolypothrix sp. PCC 7601]EKE98981.1 hypothetical protein FDUTEX481_03169 [Tolypothrix sp. PCC 7601]UYD35662.1 hypothetical protein HG267_07835 [Tolypothrix sp. PCC 7601]BAY94774.1 hypothetical protein NIES3275_68280 [Microchaete diplosiphon NIES-3275]
MSNPIEIEYDEDDDQGNFEFYGECRDCGGNMFIDLDDEEEKLACCEDCGYVIDLDSGRHFGA